MYLLIFIGLVFLFYLYSKVLAGLTVSLFNVTDFILIKTFPALLAALSPPGTFWLFAAVSLASNFFYFFFMPETRGKTGLEVKQMFNKHS